MGKHAEIHQSLAKMRAIYPLGHAGIVRIGHEQRQAEAVHEALDGALPVAVFGPHLQELADEGQRLVLQSQRLTKGGTNRQYARWDVRPPRAQRGQLALDFAVLLLEPAQLDRDLGDVVLHPPLPANRRLQVLAELTAIGEEGILMGRRG